MKKEDFDWVEDPALRSIVDRYFGSETRWAGNDITDLFVELQAQHRQFLVEQLSADCGFQVGYERAVDDVVRLLQAEEAKHRDEAAKIGEVAPGDARFHELYAEEFARQCCTEMVTTVMGLKPAEKIR